MILKKVIMLETIKNKNPFSVPKGYFTTLEQEIIENTEFKTKLGNKGFTVPDTYFTNFKVTIATEKEENFIKNKYPFSTKITIVIAIAASLLLFYFLTLPATSLSKKFENLSDQELTAYVMQLEDTELETEILLNSHLPIEKNSRNVIEKADVLETYILQEIEINEIILE